MKCNEAEKWILLQDSGEIASKQTGALVAHLHDCEDCRRFRHALMESQESFQHLETPPQAVVDNIKREARKLAPQSNRPKIFLLRPALAMAASVLIGLGFFLSTFRPDTVGVELTETELLETHDQIVGVMYSGLSDDDLAFNFLMTYEGEI